MSGYKIHLRGGRCPLFNQGDQDTADLSRVTCEDCLGEIPAHAARASFAEDHSLRARSWGQGRHDSIPTTEGAEGRNWVGD